MYPSTKPIPHLIRSLYNEGVGAELAPGIVSNNDDMLTKDFLGGVQLRGAAGRWPGMNRKDIADLRSYVAEGQNSDDPSIRNLVSDFQGAAQAKLGHLDDVQHFGLFGRSDSQDADYAASMADLRSSIQQFLSSYRLAKKMADAKKKAQAAADAAAANAAANPGTAPMTAAPPPGQAQLPPGQYPPGYDPNAYQPGYGQQYPQGYGQPPQYGQQYPYAPPNDFYAQQDADFAQELAMRGYGATYGELDDYSMPSLDNPGIRTLEDEPPTGHPLADASHEEQAMALASRAGVDPGADYLIYGLARLESDPSYALHAAGGDSARAAVLQARACEINDAIRGHVQGYVEKTLYQEGVSGDVPPQIDIGAALASLLPPPLQAAINLLGQALGGDKSAAKKIQSIKKAADSGDPDAKDAIDTLQVADVLTTGKQGKQRRVTKLPGGSEVHDLYSLGME